MIDGDRPLLDDLSAVAWTSRGEEECRDNPGCESFHDCLSVEHGVFWRRSKDGNGERSKGPQTRSMYHRLLSRYPLLRVIPLTALLCLVGIIVPFALLSLIVLVAAPGFHSFDWTGVVFLSFLICWLAAPLGVSAASGNPAVDCQRD
ncbi:MAG: hypothetical protein P8182_19840 [Deltaproteobacteria bacterium]